MSAKYRVHTNVSKFSCVMYLVLATMYVVEISTERLKVFER